MGCKDSLGPYWANEHSEGNGPNSEGNGPNRDRDDSEGCRVISGVPGLRRSARPRCQSCLQQWEGASTSKGLRGGRGSGFKAGRDGKSLTDFQPNSRGGDEGGGVSEH